MLLLGKPVVEKLKDETTQYVTQHNLEGSRVAIFLLNGTKASEIYVKMKSKYAKSVGLVVDVMFGKDRELSDLYEEIDRCNADPTYVGIMVQMPVAEQFQSHKMAIVDRISPSKDIDGLGSVMFGKAGFGSRDVEFLSATYRSAMHILDYYGYGDVKGKVCLVIGKSNLIGKPLMLGLAKRGATVLSANSKTPPHVLQELFGMADVVCSATGVKHLVGERLLRREPSPLTPPSPLSPLPKGEEIRGELDFHVPLSEKVLVDIGWGSDEGGAYGDIDWEFFQDKVKAVTPVPGGVGPATVASLFWNVRELGA